VDDEDGRDDKVDFSTGVTVIDEGIEMGLLLPGIGKISTPGLFDIED